MSKTSKAYREAAEKIDRERLYTPLEAAKLALPLGGGRWLQVLVPAAG